MNKETILLSIFVGIACIITAVTIYHAEELRNNKVDAAGFGISPPYIYAENLRPGDTYTQSIRILRSDSGSSQKVTARFDDLEIADWFDIKPAEEIIIESGEKYARFKFELKVPEDAYSGRYQGKLYFAIAPIGASKGVAIGLGARADININIIEGRDISVDLIESKSQNILADNILVERLQGRFIMRTQSRGQLYYLHPGKKKIYYLSNAEDFLNLFREEARGISNLLLNKISLDLNQLEGDDSDSDGLPDLWEDSLGTAINTSDTDDDGFDDLEELKLGFSPFAEDTMTETSKEVAESVSGFLLLQVEAKGQAWYVNPVNNKRILLTDFNNILNILERVALGISEENYQKLVE